MSQEAERGPPRRLQRRRSRCKRCRSASMEKGEQPCSSGSAAPSGSTPGLKEELQCPICYEPFREAVTLPCGHNFCRGCISRSWENQRHACPLCKESSSLGDLRVNHTLRNLVELVMREEGQRQGRGAALCPLHQEERKFFCLEDRELACFACQSSEQHLGHKMRPVQEAAADFRAKLANMESSLRDKAKDFGAMRRSYEFISRHNEAESQRLERQVKWEFEKLHKFLWDEEQAVLAQLREETGRKQDLIQGKMEQLAEASRALLNEAARLHADLKQDDYTFLMTHKNRKRRIACTAEEPEAVPLGMLLDVAKYLGSLQYNVWKKMLDTISAYPFSLDPNSAACWLSVSEDLSSVSSCGYKGSVENPERFTSAPCILGSRGFSEGFHTWEVDLGGLTNWRVGVSRPHKDSHCSFHHDSRSGFWYIYHLHGKDECRASNAVRSQTALGNIRRIRVELDCTEGELSFYDADLQSHIYTFHEKFGGVVYPYFYVGSSQDKANTNTLRICPLRVRVLEDVPT
ncbi:E3 ubiquitin-protein ligase TRIM35 isoform X2 [Passer montanus]|uniref:E3 ubiquitin-protein ligase TRIM35 isoform X1 n=1 Tax=Passer montanus TaxID=9160 RepID=UPI001960B586|nr:E3 ubiquitin-protein ligase TRIM35 isoform X1 [Passer montanus]XP_039567858.1 E3 ubiquitin-protein ligase TRIM35 isoform X2 [Passer montanus]